MGRAYPRRTDLALCTLAYLLLCASGMDWTRMGTVFCAAVNDKMKQWMLRRV